MLSLNNKTFIKFLWPLKSYLSEYLDAPMDYFSYLLGHEGEHSLFALLKEEGLCLSLTAASFDELKVLSYFYIKTELTSKGIEQLDRVIEYTYAYLKMLKQKGINRRVFEEVQRRR